MRIASSTVSLHASLGIFQVPSPTTGIFAPLRSVSGSIISIVWCPSVPRWNLQRTLAGMRSMEVKRGARKSEVSQ